MTPLAFYKKSAVYGRRLGRPLSSSKRQTLEGGTQAFAFALPETDASGTLSPNHLFPDASKNLVLEIGFGYGEHLLMKAQAHPDWNFIGVEPYVNGLSNLFKEATELNLTNIRTYQGNGHHLLHHLEPQSVDEIYLLFPDPWPKKRHNKRRFFQRQTLLTFHKALKENGSLLIATDHVDYAEWIEKILSASPEFEWSNQASVNTPPLEWVTTRYQEKGLQEGRPPRFYKLIKK